MADDKIVWELDLDEEAYRRAVNNMIADSGRLDSQFDDLAVGAKKIDKAVSAIDGDVRVNVSVNDTDLRDAKRKKEDLSGSERTTVSVNDEDLRAAINAIKDLRDIKVISITLDVIDKISNFDPTQIPIVGTINELDMAVGRLTATTGREIPDAANIIRSVYNGAWGESYDEVGRVVAQLDAAGVSTDDLATQAANALDTVNLTGEDTQRIIQVASRLVSSGLANSFTEAFDIINRGYQLTNGRADDLLDTLNEYSPLIADAGFSADEFLTTLNQGLEAGAFNTDKVADAVKEFGLRGQQAFVGADENFTNALDALGINISDYEGAGADLLQAVVDGMTAKLASGELTTVDIQALVPNLFGSPGEDVGVSVLLSFDLDQESVDSIVGQMDGVTQTVSQNLNDNLGTAWTSFTRTVESELVIALDRGFDISGKIDAAKAAVSTFASELQSGETFGGALEIALQMPGLENALDKLTSVIGNLAIELLSGIGSITSIINEDLSNAIFDEVARLSEGQLQYDLGIAVTPDDVNAALATAARRGVGDPELRSAVEESVNAALQGGNLDVAGAIQEGVTNQAWINPEDVAFQVDQFQGEFVTQMAQALAEGDYGAAYKAFYDGLAAGVDPSAFAPLLGSVENALGATVDKMDIYGTSTYDARIASEQFAGAIGEGAVLPAVETLKTQVTQADGVVQMLGNTMLQTQSDADQAWGGISNSVLGRGAEIRAELAAIMEYTTNIAVAWGAMGITTNATTGLPQVNGINGMQAGAGAGNTTNSTSTTNNVNMTVNTQSNAQATQFADTALRGF